ncbi:PTS ascorbate transporter subunit IIC [Candidatus Liberibacter sp.]|uniref:PTS ascorbate transporter subunit IIC n=1 Tax=Candidatus Liberibacter sp. TaxID=34022 RepID=UPI0015F4E292|nr:PTS ascorbate transporter subunit IIC [Candidatus Liberibacter sp.]MBA5724363.1 PTS ascorbate transporter subunit IIC [Candidatus Liberibacter sp.]
MDFITAILTFFYGQILAKPSFMLGMIVLLGNILLKKGMELTIPSTIRTIVGFLLLKIGAGILVDTSRNIITKLSDFHQINGSIIDPYVSMISSMSLLKDNYSWVGYTVLIGFLLNLLIVALRRITGIRTIVLNGEVMFQQAGLTVTFFHLSLNTDAWLTIAYSSCLISLYWGITSNILYKPTQEITQNAGFSIGHQQQFASWIACKIAPYFGDKSENINSIKLPHWLTIFNDYIVATGIIMTIFWGIALLSLGIPAVQEMAGKTHWSLYILETGMFFAIGVSIIVLGVQMFVKEISIAFQGISQHLIPGAVLAIDCSAMYGWAPNAIIWGFLWGALGQIFTIIVMLLFRYPILVVPGFIPMFFSNATIGIFANHYGGWRAASKICFVMGIIEILGSLWAMKITEMDSWMGMADWALVAPFIMQGFKLSHFFIIPILIFAAIYMFYAGRQLRLSEDQSKDSQH